jgi:group II intron reverse transcriptase/maturase
MELLSKILDDINIDNAYKQVISNKGCEGVDGVSVDDLKVYMETNWAGIKQSILEGRYFPQSVLGVEIPKGKCDVRLLGIPVVIDRLIQQAIQQVLSVIFDIEFSEFSYGFRKGRSVHHAVIQARRYINSGSGYIIDLDLRRFFDIVNHDYLMSLLNRKIDDRMLMKLIRRYLQSDIMLGGLTQQREEGTPQGSPLSPLLSNIILNELDKELEKRGHRFIRYADDCSIFVFSERAAERVLNSITKFIEVKLHLKVNDEKTNICRPLTYSTLGYAFVQSYKKGDKCKFDLQVSTDSMKRMKQRVKKITCKTAPISFNERMKRLREFVIGWVNYYKYARFKYRLFGLDRWVRSRIRYCIWKQWKKPNKRWRSFIRLGVSYGIAYSWSRSRMGGWAIARSPIMRTTVTNDRLQKRGYLSFSVQFSKSYRTVPSEVQLKFSFV